MSSENKRRGSVSLKGRRELVLEGITEMIDFDEETLHAKSVDGEIFVDGRGIKIGILDTDQGIVTLTGEINSVYYSDDTQTEKKGFFKRLMR